MIEKDVILHKTVIIESIYGRIQYRLYSGIHKSLLQNKSYFLHPTIKQQSRIMDLLRGKEMSIWFSNNGGMEVYFSREKKIHYSIAE